MTLYHCKYCGTEVERSEKGECVRCGAPLSTKYAVHAEQVAGPAPDPMGNQFSTATYTVMPHHYYSTSTLSTFWRP